jgi:hypothetical protein
MWLINLGKEWSGFSCTLGYRKQDPDACIKFPFSAMAEVHEKIRLS